MTDELLEQLAELEHEQWIHWTKYFLNNISDENLEIWKVQCETKYKDLSEKEKQSDREWAMKNFKVITKHNFKKAFGNEK